MKPDQQAHDRPVNVLHIHKHSGVYFLVTKTWNNWNHKWLVTNIVVVSNTFKFQDQHFHVFTSVPELLHGQRVWQRLRTICLNNVRLHSSSLMFLVVWQVLKRFHSTAEFGRLSTQMRFICINASHSLFNLKNYKKWADDMITNIISLFQCSPLQYINYITIRMLEVQQTNGSFVQKHQHGTFQKIQISTSKLAGRSV